MVLTSGESVSTPSSVVNAMDSRHFHINNPTTRTIQSASSAASASNVPSLSSMPNPDPTHQQRTLHSDTYHNMTTDEASASRLDEVENVSSAFTDPESLISDEIRLKPSESEWNMNHSIHHTYQTSDHQQQLRSRSEHTFTQGSTASSSHSNSNSNSLTGRLTNWFHGMCISPLRYSFINQHRWKQKREQSHQTYHTYKQRQQLPVYDASASELEENTIGAFDQPIASFLHSESHSQHTIHNQSHTLIESKESINPIDIVSTESDSVSVAGVSGEPANSTPATNHYKQPYQSLDSYVIDTRKPIRNLPHIIQQIHLEFERLFSPHQMPRLIHNARRQCLDDTFELHTDPRSRIGRSWQMTLNAHQYLVNAIRSRYNHLYYGGFERFELLSFISGDGGIWKPHFDNFISDVEDPRHFAFIIFLQTNDIPLQSRSHQYNRYEEDQQFSLTNDNDVARFCFPALRVSIVPTPGLMIAFALVNDRNDILQASLNEIEEVKRGEVWCAVTYYRTPSASRSR